MRELEAEIIRILNVALAQSVPNDSVRTAEEERQVEATWRAWQALQGVKFIAETMERAGGPSDSEGWEERAACALVVLADSALPILGEVVDGLPVARSGGARPPEQAEQFRPKQSAPLLHPL